MGQDMIAKLLPARDMLLNEFLVDKPVAAKHMHKAQGQGTVGAGLHAGEVVGIAGRRRLIGVDAPDFCAVLAGKLHVVTEVDVGGQHADAPENNEVTAVGLLGGRGQRAAHDVAIAARFCRRADGAVKARGAQLIEEAVAGTVLDGAHGASIGVGQDSLGTERINNGFPLAGDGRNGGVPADRRKFPAALGADTFEGRRKACRRVHRALVARHLGAERAAGIAVARVAFYFDNFIALGIDKQPAAVGAVVGAGGFLDFHVDTSIVFITLYYTTRN